uniref:Cadherin domain-containing protein n=1 Tax=Trichogramma kaykai TaxID=54128 RepID=A0ABD2W183_9HYME
MRPFCSWWLYRLVFHLVRAFTIPIKVSKTADALAKDRGENVRISYSMTSGNVGNVFSIDPELGIIRVARELNLDASSEYILLVKATDYSPPMLVSCIPVHVMVTFGFVSVWLRQSARRW